MGPKPTAVDQAGRPPRKLWAGPCGFETAAQEFTVKPVSMTVAMSSSLEMASVVRMVPESASWDTSALITPGMDSSTRLTRPEHPLQVMPVIVR